ncbi:MAG: aminopeptidase P family protein [Clostridium sp.]|uniref:aminopeptidase P family protein n=1 Tax=Clostridium sp. TaxID=1506 RepID=UPI003EE66DDC
MKKRNIDYYIITSNDAHQSEYVPEYYKGREYISGFTGSAGILLVGLNEGILWTDGRYFIQAEEQIKEAGLKMFKMRIQGWQTIFEWLESNMKENEVLGFDGRCVSIKDFEEYANIVKKKNGKLEIQNDLLNEFWEDRPSLSKEKIFIHDVKYAGKKASEKIDEVKEEMKNLNAENYIIASLDDIAWLLNLRGNDVKNNPVFLSYVLITKEKTTLFIDLEKVTEGELEYLKDQKVQLKEYDEIFSYVKELKGTTLLQKEKINSLIGSMIPQDIKVINEINITTKLKAIKNEVEIENLKACQVKDGIAMVKFMKWLKENIKKEKITEISASEKMTEFRSKLDLFKGTSFDSICGHKEHGAMMHYSATKESDYELEGKGFLLLDSGGQYLDGTTDITRTFILGELTKEERDDYTLVLKGHINLAITKFLKGTSGSNLDIRARIPLWEKGIDYKCGTGHGVGFFLNVHEGPQSISPVPNIVKLELGMILTNEPGVYREGSHGIRIENTMLVVKESEDLGFGEFYKFETISYCPIDIDGLNVDLLNEVEKEWINEYHEKVYEKISIFLNEDEKKFLKLYTRGI